MISDLLWSLLALLFILALFRHDIIEFLSELSAIRLKHLKEKEKIKQKIIQESFTNVDNISNIDSRIKSLKSEVKHEN